MAKKTCPDCGTKHGVRKKVCDCGHNFQQKLTDHPLYPEPGGWVMETGRGFPKIQPPEPLKATATVSNKEIQEHVAYEGLGFCIHGFIRPEQIEDKKLARLWAEARENMVEIVSYLAKNV